MGLDLLLGLLLKALPYILGAAVVIGAYFGIKSRGVKQERDRQELAAAKDREATKARVDEARAKDQEIDRRVAEETKPQPPPPPDGPLQPGDKFKFVLPFVLTFLLTGCSVYGRTPTVRVDIPPRPVLAACPEKPTTEGTVSADGTQVLLPMVQAKALRAWIVVASECWRLHEAVLWGYAEKLENRLKALSP